MILLHVKEKFIPEKKPSQACSFYQSFPEPEIFGLNLMLMIGPSGIQSNQGEFMRRFILILVLCLPLTAFADYSYECYSLDNNNPHDLNQINLNIDVDSGIEIELVSMELTETYKINGSYSPRSDRMKNFHQLKVFEPDYTKYPDQLISPIYIEKTLISGGYKLRRGGMGGFLKTAGWGYSWANYLCVLQ